MGVPLFRWGTTVANSTFIPTNMIIDAITFIQRAGTWLNTNPFVAGGQLGRAYIELVLANQQAIIGGSLIVGGGIGAGPIGPGETPLEKLRNAAIGAAIVAIFGTGARAAKGFPKVPKEWDTFVESGGGQSHLYIGPRTAEQLVGGLARRPYGKTPSEIWKNYKKDGLIPGVLRPIYDNNVLVRHVTDILTLRSITEFGGAVENAPRLAAFRLAEATGLDRNAAVLMGRDITLDFQRAGRIIRNMNYLMPYLNASVQGVERLFSKDLSRLFNKETAPRAALYTLLPLILTTIGSELSGRAQNLEAWQDIPDHIKDTGNVFQTPVDVGKNEDGSKKYPLVLWIPIRRELQFIKVLITHTLETILGDDPNHWKRAEETFFKTVPGTEDISAFLPPLAQEVYEQAANYDFWRNQPIVPDAVSITPDKYEEGWYVSETAKKLGPEIGKIPGLPAGFSSPIRIDHAVQALLGSVGKQALGISDFI